MRYFKRDHKGDGDDELEDNTLVMEKGFHELYLAISKIKTNSRARPAAQPA